MSERAVAKHPSRAFLFEARRARLRLAVQHLSNDIDRDDYIRGIETVLGPPRVADEPKEKR